MEYKFKLAPWRNYVIGILLILMGLFIFILSFIGGFSKDFLISLFTSFPEIIILILYLTILWVGISYIRKAKNNIRLKIDNKRIVYRQSSKTRYEPLFTNFDLDSEWKIILLNNVMYSQISHNNIELKLKNGTTLKLIDVGGLSKKDKYKIVDLINQRCS